MERLRLATVWLGGCSGCHMSFLDLDEWLIELAKLADIVFTPLADIKEFPENVDATLVEGAVANEDNFHFIQLVRARSHVLVSFGDCAVTGNVTALRNPLGSALSVLQRGYVELADVHPQIPSERGLVPRLLERVLPVHQVVAVDYFIPGCPPPAERIRSVLESLVQGKPPHLEGRDLKFG
jgi:NAD-reducing hydrogenase small subunit